VSKQAPVSVREASVDDAEAIATVQVGSWLTTYPGLVAQEYLDALSVADRAAAWTRWLSGERGEPPTALLAESGGSPIGFAAGGRIREPQAGFDAELYAIYLVREAQGHGLGTRLLRAWAPLMVGRGFRAAVVRVLAANPARRFYERRGARWVKDGELTIGTERYAEVWFGWDDLQEIPG